MGIESVASPAMWAGLFGFVVVMLTLDLGILNRSAEDISVRRAAVWTCFWVLLAILFNLIILRNYGPTVALDFLTGYLIEQSLSVDNLFVFLLIFSYFNVPRQHQRSVLFYGILGAIVMRSLFIVIGAALIQRFDFILLIFGGVLVLSGIRLLREKAQEFAPDKNPIVRLSKKLVRVTDDYRDGAFFVRENGKLWATPLLFVLLSVEITDLIFAIDSIPAIFAITTDPFIVFGSNIFAILGLRSLYFVLAAAMTKLRFLNIGLALILIFVGLKMFLGEFVTIPTLWSLAVIATLIIGSVTASLVWPQPDNIKPK